MELAVAVNADQTTIFVRDVSPIEKFVLPQTLLIGDEQVTVTAVDSFKTKPFTSKGATAIRRQPLRLMMTGPWQPIGRRVPA